MWHSILFLQISLPSFKEKKIYRKKFQQVWDKQSLHLPGPAVTAATPTTPDNLATASAANTAVT